VTAVLLAVAVELILERPRPGVAPPEVALDAEELFGRVCDHVPTASSLDELVHVTAHLR
jgi:hypothetical protein